MRAIHQTPDTGERERAEAEYGWHAVADVAEITGVSEDTVCAWIRAPGGLTALNVGTDKRPRWRIRHDWLDAFLARRTVNGDAA